MKSTQGVREDREKKRSNDRALGHTNAEKQEDEKNTKASEREPCPEGQGEKVI